MTQTASVKQEKTGAAKTLAMIREGKNEKLRTLVPEGQSPKLYIDLIKSQVFTPDKAGNSRSDDDFLLFLYTAKRTGLDPLTGQVHAVFRWDSRLGKEKMAIQTGIDGFRLVAQRTKQYAGQDDAKFDPEDEATKQPKRATVTVYKFIQGERVAFTATARWAEYAVYNKTQQGMKLSPMWERMPYTMLAKCAEALALRKGFPNELSGIYTTEEMGQADNPIEALPVPQSKEHPQMLHGGTETAQVSKLGSETPKLITEELKQEAEPLSETQAKPKEVVNIAKIRKGLIKDDAVEIN